MTEKLLLVGSIPFVTQFESLSAAVADEAQLGFHLCFGTFGGWLRFAPEDLGRTVELANAISAAVARDIDWFHIPALDTTEDAFYSPLAELDVGSAQVYLGLVHSMDSFSARYKTAKKYLPEFGMGAYCGLGRLQPSEVEGSFRDHQRAVEIAREIAGGT